MADEKREYTDAEKAAYWKKKALERRKAGGSRRSSSRTGRGSRGRVASVVARRRTGKTKSGHTVGRPGRAEAFNGGYTRYKRKTNWSYRGRSRRSGGQRSGRQRSGCILYPGYRNKEGNLTVKIFAWRYTPAGKQVINAFVSKNDGKPKSGADPEKYLVFVVNHSIPGVSQGAVSGVFSDQFQKLSFSIGGQKLVAKPAPEGKKGGYFGPGGSKLRSKFK